MAKNGNAMQKKMAKKINAFLYYDDYTNLEWKRFLKNFRHADLFLLDKVDLVLNNAQQAYINKQKLLELIDDVIIVELVDRSLIYQVIDVLHERYADSLKEKEQNKNAIISLNIFYAALHAKIAKLNVPVISKLAIYAYTRYDISIASVLLRKDTKVRGFNDTVEALLQSPQKFSKLIAESHLIPKMWLNFYNSQNEVLPIIGIVLKATKSDVKYWEVFLRRLEDCLRKDSGVATEALSVLDRWDRFAYSADSMLLLVRVLTKLARSSIDADLIVDLLRCDQVQSFSHQVFSLNDPKLNIAYLKFVSILKRKVSNPDFGEILFGFRFWESKQRSSRPRSVRYVQAFLSYAKKLVRNKVDNDIIISALQSWDDAKKNKSIVDGFYGSRSVNMVCSVIKYLMNYHVATASELLKLFSPNRLLVAILHDSESKRYIETCIGATFRIYQTLLDGGAEQSAVFADIKRYFDSSVSRDPSDTLYSESVEKGCRVLKYDVSQSVEFFDFIYDLSRYGMEKEDIQSILSQRVVSDTDRSKKSSKSLFDLKMGSFTRFELTVVCKIWGLLHDADLIPSQCYNADIRKYVFASINILKNDDQKLERFRLIRDRSTAFSKLFWVKTRSFLVHARYEIPKEIRERMKQEEIRIQAERVEQIADQPDPVSSLDPVYIDKSRHDDVMKDLEALPSPSNSSPLRKLGVHAVPTDPKGKEKRVEAMPLLANMH